MNPTVIRDIERTLQEGHAPGRLKCAGPLEIASRLVSAAAGKDTTATTVVGVLGYDDVDAFRSLVSAMSLHYGVVATISIKPGSYAVRFSRSPDNTRGRQSRR